MTSNTSTNAKCIQYTGQGDQNEYNELYWYYKEIKSFMMKYPHSNRRDQWNWFKHITYFKQSTLWSYCNKHQSLKVKKRKIKPTFFETITEQLLSLFTDNGHSNDTQYIIKTLNKLCSVKTAPSILRKFPLGGCLAAMIELERTFAKIGNNKTYTIQMHKQIIFL